ncbi:hypothetical protein, partial [uncultured Actinobacillus sp.]
MVTRVIAELEQELGEQLFKRLNLQSKCNKKRSTHQLE